MYAEKGTPIAEEIRRLRALSGNAREAGERAATALARASTLWEKRLAEGWQPPSGSAYPWEQVRLSLAALLPGLTMAKGGEGADAMPSPVAGLILAGNTPLMSWAPLCACLLAGYSVFVKQSREETLWPRLFVESLTEVDPVVAARIHLDVWPGEDERTTELLRAVDVVIAFGSDSTIAALRNAAPPETPFFGFGHSISVGAVFPLCCPLSGMTDPFSLSAAADFARDALMYDQQGCLSPQAIFVEGDAVDAREVGSLIAKEMAEEAERLAVCPIEDAAVAYAIRQARDMAHFSGATVLGDEALRWTVLVYRQAVPLPSPVGHAVLSIIPVSDAVHEIGSLLIRLNGAISCVGIAGEIDPGTRAALTRLGISRLCAAGEMQIPPLDWPNGNIDLLAELHRLLIVGPLQAVFLHQTRPD